MKYLFGKYLVDQGIVSNVDLLEALIKQFQEMPSIAEVVRKAKLITIDQQLMVLAYQEKNQSDYLDAAKQLKLLSDVQISKVLDLLNTQHRPVGEILLSQGKIDFDVLVEAIKSFKDSGCDRKEKCVDEQRLDDFLITEYCYLLSHDAYEFMLQTIYQLNFKDPNALGLEDLEDFVLKLKAACHLVRLEKSQPLIDKFLAILQSAKLGNFQSNQSIARQLLLNITRMIWSFRESIKSQGIESSALVSQENRQQYDLVMGFEAI